MDRVCIYIAYNGKWTKDNKYLDHEIKLLLVNDGITFEGLIEKIYQVLKLKVGETKANIWFDTNLETSKGMLVTNDGEVTTCIYLLKNDPNFKTSRFIVDFAEDNSLSAVNIVQQEEMQIERDEASIPVEPITEFEPLETKSSHGMKLRKRPQNRKVLKKRKRSRSKRDDLSRSVILRENASLDEIVVGSLFANKECLKKCFTNSAIRNHFKFKTVRSTKKRYYLKCYDDKCRWFLHSSRIRDSTLFKISKYVKTHTCSADVLQPDQQRHATSRVISDYIRELLPEYETEMTPNFVKEEMRKRYGLNISYHKAWRSIQLAFGVKNGSLEQNNEFLPLEQNNDLLMSEPEQNNELLPYEQNNDLLMSKPEQNNELLPYQPLEQNNDLLMSEPEQNNELLLSEPEQKEVLLPSEPEQKKELLPSEPGQNNELLPSEPEQKKEMLPSEPEQKIELLPSEPEEKNELLLSESEQNNRWLSSEPEQNNKLVPSEPEQNNEVLPSEETNLDRDD
ncbi:hypothetical protein RND71_003074 [Anisodus tanguticus]|uniref:Transposase MuDR plant domain-containing protein n=1 Tax=Anisodus tanguticus TaxID=243964 RepID=A0AAE1VND9_9SOLA|nr:hypothetical protein RND71_003074 [Anisodus tanguticus]